MQVSNTLVSALLWVLTVPASRELAFILFATLAAIPRSLRAFLDNRGINQLFCTIVVEFVDDP
jgi:hypothetical protein